MATQPNALIAKRIRNAAKNKVERAIDYRLFLRKLNLNTPREFALCLVEDECGTDFDERTGRLAGDFFGRTFAGYGRRYLALLVEVSKINFSAYFIVHNNSSIHLL